MWSEAAAGAPCEGPEDTRALGGVSAGFVHRLGSGQEVWEVGSKSHMKHRTPQVTGSVLVPGAALRLGATALIAINVPLQAG